MKLQDKFILNIKKIQKKKTEYKAIKSLITYLKHITKFAEILKLN